MLASASGHVTNGFVGIGVPDGLVHHDRDVRIQAFLLCENYAYFYRFVTK